MIDYFLDRKTLDRGATKLVQSSSQSRVLQYENRSVEILFCSKRRKKNGRNCGFLPHVPIAGGRKVTDTELEERMLRWVSLQKCQGNSVSPKRLIDEAMAISREIHGDANQFKASNGWCWRFCRRNNLGLREGREGGGER